MNHQPPDAYQCARSCVQSPLTRTGEFWVTVTASNLVSSASLSGHIFAVEQPCLPPPVKNMGPSTLQVRFTTSDLTIASVNHWRNTTWTLLWLSRCGGTRRSVSGWPTKVRLSVGPEVLTTPGASLTPLDKLSLYPSLMFTNRPSSFPGTFWIMGFTRLLQE